MLIARIFLPGDGGHSPLEGLRSESTPVVNGPGIALAAVGTLGFGAVLGPELPVIALGSIVGVAVTRFVRLDSRGTAVLSSAGSFSAVSALFGGPLVAGILLVEAGVAMGAGLVPALLPGFVAAAVGYLIFVGLGDWGGLDAPASSCPTWPRTRERICTTSASPSSSAWPQQSSSRRCTSSEFESTAFAGGWGWPCSSSAAVSRSA